MYSSLSSVTALCNGFHCILVMKAKYSVHVIMVFFFIYFECYCQLIKYCFLSLRSKVQKGTPKALRQGDKGTLVYLMIFRHDHFSEDLTSIAFLCVAIPFPGLPKSTLDFF